RRAAAQGGVDTGVVVTERAIAELAVELDVTVVGQHRVELVAPEHAQDAGEPFRRAAAVLRDAARGEEPDRVLGEQSGQELLGGALGKSRRRDALGAAGDGPECRASGRLVPPRQHLQEQSGDALARGAQHEPRRKLLGLLEIALEATLEARADERHDALEKPLGCPVSSFTTRRPSPSSGWLASLPLSPTASCAMPRTRKPPVHCASSRR